jgi:hypothetical protein
MPAIIRTTALFPFKPPLFASGGSCESTPGRVGKTIPEVKSKQHGHRGAHPQRQKISIPFMYIYGNKDMAIISAYLNHIEDRFDHMEIHQIDPDRFLHKEKPQEVAEFFHETLTKERCYENKG